MLLGSTKIFKCPICNEFHLHPTVLSANGIGAKYFSDGRVEGPGLPRVPKLTACNKCSHIFWLDEKDKYDEFEDDYYNDDPEEKKKAEFYNENYEWTNFPDSVTLKRSLQEKVFRNIQDEKYLRTWYYWKANEEILDPSVYDEPYWKENALRLIDIIDHTSQKQLLLVSELYRNMGDFEKSLDILDLVTDPNLSQHAYVIYKKCRERYRMVFDLGNKF